MCVGIFRNGVHVLEPGIEPPGLSHAMARRGYGSLVSLVSMGLTDISRSLLVQVWHSSWRFTCRA